MVCADDVSDQELGIVLGFLTHSVRATRGMAHRRLMGEEGEEGPLCKRNSGCDETVDVPSPAAGYSPALRSPPLPATKNSPKSRVLLLSFPTSALTGLISPLLRSSIE